MLYRAQRWEGISFFFKKKTENGKSIADYIPIILEGKKA